MTPAVNPVADALNAGITSETVFGTLQPFMPFIISMILISLGVYVFKRLSKGASRAKLKI